MKKSNVTLLTAIMIATSLTHFSCSGDNDDGTPSSSSVTETPSSSSETPSSSSEVSSSSSVDESGGGGSSSSQETLLGESGTFTDGRDGNVYKWVKIGELFWMAENLKYDVPNTDADMCYSDNTDRDYCADYGRLYSWATAMDFDVCPAGWHIPGSEEFEALIEYAGGSQTAGTKLKATSGWNVHYEYGNGTDSYGFSALPGGDGDLGNFLGDFLRVGQSGSWWSNKAENEESAWRMNINYDFGRTVYYYTSKLRLFSIRCVNDISAIPSI